LIKTEAACAKVTAGRGAEGMGRFVERTGVRRSGHRRERGTRDLLVVAVTGIALALAGWGCGGDDKGSSGSASKDKAAKTCKAKVGMMTVLTGAAGPQGREQLHWAQLATDRFNKANKTQIKLVEGDTQLDPAQASTVAQQFASDTGIVGVVGPESDGTVDAAGPIFGRRGMVMVSQSATSVRLTNGKYKTFYRVIAPDSVQGADDAKYMIDKLKVKKVFIIDDQTAYSTGIADDVVKKLKAAGVDVKTDSVSSKSTEFSSLVSKITPDTDVVFLPWMLAANAQLFGKQMQEQNKKATIFGSDGVFSPQDFKINGSYLSSFSPDLTAQPKYAGLVKEFESRYGQFGAFGVPTYVAAQVVLEAVKSVCDSGKNPDAKSVADAVKKTNIPTSILGQPIAFEPNGELKNAKFYIYTIKNGKYGLAP
jgi:branched-chain amino acid transport system substrate-binding protein